MHNFVYMYINNHMVGTDEIVSIVHWITRMTTKPMALDQILQKTHFLLKKGTIAIYMYVTDEKNYPMIGAIKRGVRALY